MSLKFIIVSFGFGLVILLGWLYFSQRDLGSAVQSSPLTPEWVNLMDVQNDTDYEAIKKLALLKHNNFIKQQAGISGWEPFISEGKQIPVTAGLEGLGVRIPEEFKSALSSNQWGIHSCPSNNQKPTFVLRLLFTVLPDRELITYAGKQLLLKNWEKTILSDVRNVIFPELFYGANLSQSIDFVNDTRSPFPGTRQASVISGNQASGELNYVVVGDYLFVSNDKDCMTQIIGEVIGLVP